MLSVQLGAGGALLIDEKFHIMFLKRAERNTEYTLENTCFAISDDKGRVARLDQDFTVKKVKRTFLGAVYKLVCESVPVKITVTAITPHRFGGQSQIPAALFSFKIKNVSKKKRTFCFGALVENCCEDSLHETIQEETLGGVQLGPATKLSVQSGYLTQCLAFDGSVQTARYVDNNAPFKAFSEMLRSGMAETAGCPLPAEKAYAAVMRKFEIPAGECITLNSVYAWYEPNLEFLSEDGEAHRFKCGYTACFDGSKAIADYVLLNAKSLLLQADCVGAAIENSLDRPAFGVDYFEALESVYSSVPLRLDEYGNGTMFYKNPYRSRFIFANSGEGLADAFACFNAEDALGFLNWQLDYCVGSDGRVSGVPRFYENKLCFENEDTYNLERQLTIIFSAYRLASFGVPTVSASAWKSLVSAWKRLESMLSIDEGSYMVHDDKGVCDVFKTCLYILAAICMKKLAAYAADSDFSDRYASVVESGLAFIRDRAFNGKFYAEHYPKSSDKLERCSLKQVIPFAIANLLGICLVEPKQLKTALENIYAYNYTDTDVERSGVKLYSDADEIDSTVEELYLLALMQCGKMSLASLVYKARLLRGEKFDRKYLFSMLESISKSFYCYDEKFLVIGNSSAALFKGSSVILIAFEKGLGISVFGAPVQISRISVPGEKIKRVRVDDTEYMFTQKGDAVCLKSMITLSEGERLNISLCK